MSHLRPMRGEIGGPPNTVESLEAEVETLRASLSLYQEVVKACLAVTDLEQRLRDAANVAESNALADNGWGNLTATLLREAADTIHSLADEQVNQ